MEKCHVNMCGRWVLRGIYLFIYFHFLEAIKSLPANKSNALTFY